jgi:AcrR family transcriptional regulator
MKIAVVLAITVEQASTLFAPTAGLHPTGLVDQSANVPYASKCAREITKAVDRSGLHARTKKKPVSARSTDGRTVMGKQNDVRASDIIFDDARPVSSLHPTAQRILKAAYRILEEEGLSALTFDAIAERAGHYKGSITYFFRDKATLIALLADMVARDTVASSLEKLSSITSTDDRVHEACSMNYEITRNSVGFRVLLDIMAHSLRRSDLRERMAKLYSYYRELNARMINPEWEEGHDSARESDILGALTVAITDGLSLQYALDPEGFDPEPYWTEWEELVRTRLSTGSMLSQA